MRALSDLDLDDSVDDEITDHLENHCDRQPDVSTTIREHGRKIVRLKQHKGEKGDDWNRCQEVHRQTPFGGIDTDLSTQLEAFPDDFRQGVQDFAEVSAGLTLYLK